ncbi:hypothetical protein ACWCQW_45445 [Streptomyces mirabilis]
MAARLCLTAARFHSSPPRSDFRGTRACLDRAFQEWGEGEDDHVIGALAPALRTMYEHDPDHRPDVPDAIGRRLLRRRIHPVPVQRH